VGRVTRQLDTALELVGDDAMSGEPATADVPHPAGRVSRPVDLFVGPGATIELLRVTDWDQTTLGPVADWPDALTQAIRLTMASRMPMLIWWGAELIQIYNDAYAQLIGAKHPDGIAQPAKECWTEAWADLAPLAARVISRGESTFAENMLLLIERHGYVEETYWTFSFSPIRDSTGRVAGVFVSTTDVTARVVGERRLETVRQLGTVSAANDGGVEQTCRAAVEVLAANRQAVPFAAIYLVDPDKSHAVLVASYGVAEGTSITPAQRFVLDDNPPLAKAVISGARGLATGLRETALAEAFEPGPLGDKVPDAAMLLPVSISGHRHPAAVAVLGVNPYRAVDDVYLTFFQLVARQLRVALGDALAYESERARAIALSELDEDKTRFYQNVSHEFRTPLTLILGPLGSVLDDAGSELDPRHRDSLLSARRAALRLRKMVDSLLAFSRVEADELHAQLEPTDLAALTTDLASMFRSVVEQAGLEYAIDVSGLNGTVDVDREMWAQIVLNLLSNAVKFTRVGRIALTLAAVDDQVELTVRDTGIGIPPDQLPHVFDRFTQVPGPSGRSAEGAGIGLALVDALVSAHGGQVRAESTTGQGTAFVICIPRAASAPVTTAELAARTGESAVEAYVVEARSWLQAERAIEPAPQHPGTALGQLLLVEDNADLRCYLVKLLTADGWSVHAVGSVEAALRADPPPDIIVSDVMLPGRSGIDLLHLVRADPQLRRTPVILLTARTGPDSAAEGLKAGADDYIAKPFEPTELLARVRVHHELAQLRDFALNQAQDKAANLQRALSSNRQIGIALGVLMARDMLTEDQAFERLRVISQRQNRKLRDVADEVVLTGALPGVDGEFDAAQR
jgi:signal transduction histidine kinase/DNA-binding response OmpR family regulator/PAS domain-containing protein